MHAYCTTSKRLWFHKLCALFVVLLCLVSALLLQVVLFVIIVKGSCIFLRTVPRFSYGSHVFMVYRISFSFLNPAVVYANYSAECPDHRRTLLVLLCSAHNSITTRQTIYPARIIKYDRKVHIDFSVLFYSIVCEQCKSKFALFTDIKRSTTPITYHAYCERIPSNNSHDGTQTCDNGTTGCS